MRHLIHWITKGHWPRTRLDLTGTGACALCWDLTDQ